MTSIALLQRNADPSDVRDGRLKRVPARARSIAVDRGFFAPADRVRSRELRLDPGYGQRARREELAEDRGRRDEALAE